MVAGWDYGGEGREEGGKEDEGGTIVGRGS
jgi:hypothetical protein